MYTTYIGHGLSGKVCRDCKGLWIDVIGENGRTLCITKSFPTVELAKAEAFRKVSEILHM